MNTEKTVIRLLVASAIMLLLALIFIPRHATAEVSVGAGEYQVATYPTGTGNDALYISNMRLGAVAVFVYDPATRSLQPRAVRRLDDAFIMR